MKSKKVAEIKMFGRVLMVFQREGWAYEFAVYEGAGTKIFIDEFESFQEAIDCMIKELY